MKKNFYILTLREKNTYNVILERYFISEKEAEKEKKKAEKNIDKKAYYYVIYNGFFEDIKE